MMKNTITIKSMMILTIPKISEYVEVEKIIFDYSRLIYLRHDIRLVYDRKLSEYTGEYYYRVYLLSSKDQKEIEMYVNNLDTSLQFMKEAFVGSKYYLKVTYYLIDDKKKFYKQFEKYYVNELQGNKENE